MKKSAIFVQIIFFCLLYSVDLKPLSAQIADTAKAAQFVEEAKEKLATAATDDVLELCQKAEAIYSNIDPVHLQLGYVYNVFGDAYYESGKYDKAIAYFLNAKDVLLKHYSQANFEVAQALNFLGLCYWKKGELAQASEYFQEGLNMRIEVLGKMHAKVADSYNNLGNIALNQRDLVQALDFYKTALNIRIQTLGGDHLDVASSFNNMGSCLRYAGEYEGALKYFNQSLAIRKKQLGTDHPKIAQSFLNIGDCYSQSGDLEKALSFFNNALQVFKKNPDVNQTEIGNVYNNLGSVHSQLGNHLQALDFFKKSLTLQLQHHPKDSPNLISVYNNLANTFDQQGDYQKALTYYENNLHILNSHPGFGTQHPFTAFTFNNMGQVQEKYGNFQLALDNYAKALNIYTLREDNAQIAATFLLIGNVFLDAGKYERAIMNYEKSLQLLNEMEGEKAFVYQNLGICYYNQTDYNTALTYYEKAADWIKKYKGKEHADLVKINTQIGMVFEKMGQFDKALLAYDYAFNVLEIDPQTANPPDFVNQPIELLNLLNATAKLHLAQFFQTKSAEDLLLALQYYEYAIKLVEGLRKQLQEVQSKRTLGELSYQSFEGAIRTCYHLLEQKKDTAYLEKAFYYSELSRSNLILEALNRSNATSFSGIPDSLVLQENKLKSLITFYEKKKRIALQQEQDMLVNDLNNKLFQAKENYQALIQDFEQNYPQYFSLKYASNLVDIKTVQATLLSEDHSLLEYFVSDSSLFVFVINEKESLLKEIPTEALLDKVSRHRKSIYSYYLEAQNQGSEHYQTALEAYAKTATQLYQSLIQPVENQLTKKITIINGGILNYLPFETLLSHAPRQLHKLKTYPYLLKKHEINYAYSSTLLYRLQEQKRKVKTKAFLGFAPSFKKTDHRNLKPLNHNISEVEQIQNLIGGDLFLKEKATKQQFVSLAADYQIIHLSTHGQSNDQVGDYSYLAFAEKEAATEEDVLYAKDIYDLTINADMVVLSACETGQGEATNSEGAISLGRAFFYSGAKSILNTLWSVDDASTSKLTHLFYTDLDKGSTRSAALQNAKLQLIEDGTYAHPYYWSPFMLVGEADTLDGKAFTIPLWVFGLLIGLLIACFFIFLGMFYHQS